jgi:CheY-like chemotaxis protein
VGDTSLGDISLLHAPKTTTVLVADDNIRMLEAIAKKIAPGRRVVAVQDPANAVDILTESADKIDILVTDYSFRYGNEAGFGGDFLCELAKKLNPDMETIIVSGDPGDARKTAVDHVIQKPLDRRFELTPPVVADRIRRIENKA